LDRNYRAGVLSNFCQEPVFHLERESSHQIRTIKKSVG
jgi:hypothetical protein